MARRVILADDLDNTESTEETPVLTWSFAYGPSNNVTRYTIDLTENNYAELEKALKRFVNVATEVEEAPPSPRGVSSARRSPANTIKSDPAQLAAIRDWAKGKGYEVAERGRIKQSILDEYNSENSN